MELVDYMMELEGYKMELVDYRMEPADYKRELAGYKMEQEHCMMEQGQEHYMMVRVLHTQHLVHCNQKNLLQTLIPGHHQS